MITNEEIRKDVNNIAGKDFATSAKQDTIIGYVDGIETKLADIETNQTNGTHQTKITDGTYVSDANNVSVEFTWYEHANRS